MSKKNKVKRREAIEEILERLSERMYPDKFGEFVVTLASTQSDGDGVLHTLLYSDENYPVRALVDAGADINSTGNLGYTPLHVAAWRGNLEMTEFLLSSNADKNRRCNRGKTPADVAIEMGFPDCARILR